MIQAAGKFPGVAQALRWFAGRFKEGSVVTINSGYAQGMRWKRMHAYVNGYWIGHYELEVQTAIVRILGPGDGFLDVGANAGFFSMVAIKRVGPQGWVVAVDPDPFNCDSLRAQVALNDLKNCTVLQQAVADQAGTLKFAFASGGDSTGHLADAGAANAMDVSATTLDAICEAHGKPKLIKVDVEGAEVLVLRGAKNTIETIRPAWLLEIHADELGREVRRILSAAGYHFTEISGTPLPDSDLLPHHCIALP